MTRGRTPLAKTASVPARKLLVLDSAYTLEAVRRRGQHRHILHRDLGAFFEHVWSVHPFASLLAGKTGGSRFGRPEIHELAPRHTMIEGKFGRFSWLRWLAPLNFLIAQTELFAMLLRLVRRERISAVRAPNPLYLGLFGLTLARAARVPLVIRVGANHDELRKFTGKPVEPRLFRSRRLEVLVERFVLPRADVVAGANQNNLDFALSKGARPERSTLFRYGNLIDRRHFVEPSRRRRDPALLADLGVAGEPFMISVARLEDTASVKHPDDVVRTLAALANFGFPIKALIVGEGPLHKRIVALADELGVCDRLVMAGARDQAWLADVLPQAAVHLCPHAGRALSEGALAALPTVAYDIDWQGELVETGVTGILVPYRDLAKLIDGVKAMLDHPHEAARLGRAMRDRALDLLDPAKLEDHERRTYERLLASKQREGMGQ